MAIYSNRQAKPTQDVHRPLTLEISEHSIRSTTSIAGWSYSVVLPTSTLVAKVPKSQQGKEASTNCCQCAAMTSHHKTG